MPSDREIEAAARVLLEDKYVDPEIVQWNVSDPRRYSPWKNLAKACLEAAENTRRLEN